MSLFDEAFYLSQNPDVAAAVEQGLIGSGLEHFNTFGFREGRDPNPVFDTSFYLEQNPDVDEAGINPLDHYEAFGESEGRSPSPLFDPTYYAAQYPDVVEEGVGLLEHFLDNGAGEGRFPNGVIALQLTGFSESAYLRANPDVRAAVDAGDFSSGLEHFILFGESEGRPSGANQSVLFNDGFDEDAYLLANPDVQAAVDAGTFESGYEHWLLYGFEENRNGAENSAGEKLVLPGPSEVGDPEDPAPDDAVEDETPVDPDPPAPTPVNSAPSITLENEVTEISEGADTSSRIKVADINIADDGLGTNELALTGDDALLFEFDGDELFIIANAPLDFETNPVLDVTVEVDDTSIGTTPDESTDLSINVSNVVENTLTFNDDVFPEVIFGSGNANGGFTTSLVDDVSNSLELGLRAKLRFDDNNDPQNEFNLGPDGTYIFSNTLPPSGGGFGFDPGSDTTPIWNFEWSINTDVDGNSELFLDDYTYLLEIDGDPTSGTDFGGPFDPINVPAADHAIGNNMTNNGGGTSTNLQTDPDPQSTYSNLIQNNNVAQNSWNFEFFNEIGDGLFLSQLENFDPTDIGQYTIRLSAFDSNDTLINQVEIDVLTAELM